MKHKLNILYVVGRFDDDGGRFSGYAHKLWHEFVGYFGTLYKPVMRHTNPTPATIQRMQYVNGGSWAELVNVIKDVVRISWDVIVWMPDVPNEKEKLVPYLKSNNPHAILITAKNNIEGKYQLLHLCGRALQAKSNLLLEFDKHQGVYAASLIDPLGNCFVEKSRSINHVGYVMAKRLVQLLKFTRVPSKSIMHGVGPLPAMNEFRAVAQKHAQTFHDLVHADTTRFLGNLSFRCVKGFPTFKADDDIIMVSKRNLDKREIAPENFVPVNAKKLSTVEYFGDDKPSVDTPVQLLLYDWYDNAKYMLHSHVYVKDAPFTQSVIPCGAVEEAQEIFDIYPERSAVNFAVNLLGHGSIVICDNVDYLKDIEYIGRPAPEVHGV
jgi:hypothetical protein